MFATPYREHELEGEREAMEALVRDLNLPAIE